ncbi:MAG: hypothetical protein OHK0046_44880 [Anaerolineae bacterium]
MYRIFAVLLIVLISLSVIAQPIPALQLAVDIEQPQEHMHAIHTEGMLTLLHMDPFPDSNIPYRVLIQLLADDGAHYDLVMPLEQAYRFEGRRVMVSGQLMANGSSVQVDTFAPATTDFAPQVETQPIEAGSIPFINLVCQFPENAPYAPRYDVLTKITSAFTPSVSDHFAQISYGKINFEGSATVNQVFNMPKTYAEYAAMPRSDALRALAQDCASAADSAVDFTPFAGINFFYSSTEVLGAAGIGTKAMRITVEGVEQDWKMTWMPETVAWEGLLAHEMGHTLGLLHSGSQSNGYASGWDVMSGPGRSATYNSTLGGSVSAGTIAYNAHYLGFIPATQVVEVAPNTSQTVTIERLLQPQSTTNPLLVIVPLEGTTSRFYTIEVRQKAGLYDGGIPVDDAVVIHMIDYGMRSTSQVGYVIDGDNNGNFDDEGTAWQVGEVFTDAAQSISVSVLARNATSYTVLINNAEGVPTPTPTATPLPVEEVIRLAPQPNAMMDEKAEYVSKFQWVPVAGAEWYHVFVSSPDFSQVFFDKWYPAADVCTQDVCTTTDDIWVVGNAQFAWWMTYWSELIGSQYTRMYQEERFFVALPQPGEVTGTAPTDNVSGAITLQWQANPNALWYQVWAGSADYSDTSYLQWLNGSDVCAGEVCEVNIGTLAANDYEFWIQAWNPSGITDWQKLTEFTVTP